MENIEVDWNVNALAKAKDYSETMYMSKAGIYEQLISEYGERFTEEEQDMQLIILTQTRKRMR